MPDSLKFPRMLRAIVELVCGERLARFGRRVVGELVALALGWTWGGRLASWGSGLVPSLAAVIGALDDLPEPAARLRCVKPVGIGGRSLEMVDLPAGEVRAADFPVLALAVGGKNECAFACAGENPDCAHVFLLCRGQGPVMSGQSVKSASDSSR